MTRWERFKRWFMEGTPPPPPGYCLMCGRRRYNAPGLNAGAMGGTMYVPTNPWERKHLCTPQSCKYYDLPSVPDPPTRGDTSPD